MKSCLPPPFKCTARGSVWINWLIQSLAATHLLDTIFKSEFEIRKNAKDMITNLRYDLKFQMI